MPGKTKAGSLYVRGPGGRFMGSASGKGARKKVVQRVRKKRSKNKGR